jgi:protein transport protein SEC13
MCFPLCIHNTICHHLLCLHNLNTTVTIIFIAAKKMSDSRSQTVHIETQHTDVVHDSQFDYYGQLIATASSDGSVKIFSTKDQQLRATLTGHEGPVWTVAWAHPRFGSVLATASFDKRILIWKEGGNQWRPVHVISVHNGSVNSVAWAPQEYGAILASASSDGTVAVTRCTEGSWREPIKAVGDCGVTHPQGATAVSFAPYHASLSEPVFVSGGCDGKVRFWRGPSDNSGVATLDEKSWHTDWVRDVAFSPDSSSTFVVVASCGQDKKVCIARKQRSSILEKEGEWEFSVTEFKEPIWRLSWSPCGTMLLATTGDSEVFVLTEGKSFTDPWTIAPVNETTN